MNWFCCKYFYTVGCDLDCCSLELNLVAEQDGTHIFQFSYQNSPIVHTINITDVEIGDPIVVPRNFNPNNFIWFKIIQPDGTYLSSTFLDENDDPILDENTGNPITSECYIARIYPERVHYDVSIDDSCNDCTIVQGYSSVYLTFFEERNQDIHYIKFGNIIINLNNFDGPILSAGLTSTQVHTAIADYFDNTTNAALLDLIDRYSISITTFPDKIRIRTKSVIDGNDLCDTRPQFFNSSLYPIDVNTNEFQCCFENDTLDDRCQYSTRESMFYIQFNQIPYTKDLYIVFNQDDPATTAHKLLFDAFNSSAELDLSIQYFNQKYQDYFIKRISNNEIVLYATKYKCDDVINIYSRTNGLEYYLIDEIVGVDIEANCCEDCDYQNFATFKFYANIDLSPTQVYNKITNEVLFELPPLDVTDIPQFLTDASILNPTHSYSIVDGAITISVPLSELFGYECGMQFEIRTGYTVEESINYPNNQIIECCFS